ncbi:btk-binding protein-related [Anaeramoeba flamelloides]|uniref:Btk-binding protein-related n=1 Tax=Anaeramoeba flamelloides TaxID=1746091 RepID=A0AAV7YD41_9EUKA|nr:btk-binding protein-related [Anaeramoeba flamelloides]
MECNVVAFGKVQGPPLKNNKGNRIREPTQLPLNEIIDVCCSRSETLYQNFKGIFTHFKQNEKTGNTFVVKNEIVVDVKSGANHFLFLTKSGKVFGLGSNEHFQIGTYSKSHEKPTLIYYFKKESHCMAGIACSANTSYFLTTCGKLFSSGTNTYGEKGSSKRIPDEPISLVSDNVCYVSSGTFAHHFCYCTGNFKQLYVSGRGKSGQLGLKNKKNIFKPALVLDLNLEMDLIEYNSNEFDTIKKVVCSKHCTLVLLNSGVVLSTGNSKIIGRETEEEQQRLQFQQITSLRNLKVNDLVVGDSHAIAITDKNLIYVWGTNSKNELGVNDSMVLSSVLPTQIQIPKIHKNDKIKLHCGNNCSFVYTSMTNSLYPDFERLFQKREFCDLEIHGLQLHRAIVELRLHTKITKELIQQLESKFEANATYNFFKWLYSEQSEKLIPNPIFYQIAQLFGVDGEMLQNMSLERDLESLLADTQSMDFTIKIGTGALSFHKIILIARSQLYRGMFLSSNCGNEIQDYSGYSLKTLRILRKFFYTGKVFIKKFDQKIFNEIKNAPYYFQFDDLDFLSKLKKLHHFKKRKDLYKEIQKNNQPNNNTNQKQSDYNKKVNNKNKRTKKKTKHHHQKNKNSDNNSERNRNRNRNNNIGRNQNRNKNKNKNKNFYQNMKKRNHKKKHTGNENKNIKFENKNENEDENKRGGEKDNDIEKEKK